MERLEALSLDNRFVQTAFVITSIALSCIAFPFIGLHIKNFFLSGFRFLHTPFHLLFTLINSFLPSFSSFAQIAISTSLLAIGSFFFPSVKKGASFFLSNGISILLSLLLYLITSLSRKKRALPIGKNGLLWAILIVPILEEIFFRKLLPLIFSTTVKSICFIASQITKKDFSPTAEKIITKVENIFSSSIFGICHLKSSFQGKNIFHCLYTGTLAALTLYPSHKKNGLPASTSAHISNNLYAVILEKLKDFIFANSLKNPLHSISLRA